MNHQNTNRFCKNKRQQDILLDIFRFCKGHLASTKIAYRVLFRMGEYDVS